AQRRSLRDAPRWWPHVGRGGGPSRGGPRRGSSRRWCHGCRHRTENVQCGEGGALVINDMSLHARAEIIRDKGTNRGDFLRGVVGRYRWMDIGSSYLPSEILAAFLTAQLESFEEIQHRRGTAWQAYHSGLAD